MKNAMKIIMAALAFFALSFQGMAMLTEEAALVTTCMPTKELYFQNRSLLDVGDLAITGFQKFGGSTDTRAYRWTAGPLGPNVGTFSDSGLYLYANDGSTLDQGSREGGTDLEIRRRNLFLFNLNDFSFGHPEIEQFLL